MFYQLTALAEEGLTPAAAAWAGGFGLIIGLLLWLGGSRFSQALVTLAAVGAGAYLGKRLPGWMGSGIDPIGTAFGGALVLGIVGYVYHRMWVGVGLGLLMAGWTAVGTWMVMSGGEAWIGPTFSTPEVAAIARAFWETLPGDVQKVMPWTAGVAGMVGMTLGVAWPRVAGRMFFSMLGLSVVATAGVTMHRASWLQKLLPGDAYVQVGAAAGLVVFGMTVQWWIGPRRVAAAENPTADENDE